MNLFRKSIFWARQSIFNGWKSVFKGWQGVFEGYKKQIKQISAAKIMSNDPLAPHDTTAAGPYS